MHQYDGLFEPRAPDCARVLDTLLAMPAGNYLVHAATCLGCVHLSPFRLAVFLQTQLIPICSQV